MHLIAADLEAQENNRKKESLTVEGVVSFCCFFMSDYGMISKSAKCKRTLTGKLEYAEGIMD